jgi:serine/threonine-protein kinase
MRRHSEAERELDRALAISPSSVRATRLRAMVMLARGDLEGARAFLRNAAEQLDRDEFIAHLAVFDDLYWVLDDAWQRRLLELDVEPFGGYESDRDIAFANTFHLRGDHEQARIFAGRARAELARQLEEFPEDPYANRMIGVMLAFLGRRDEAVSHGKRSIEMWEAHPDVPYRYSQLQLVRIHLLLGDNGPALELLEPLLSSPFYLTPGWLRIDPMFDPLRDQPGFKALVEGGAPA